MVAHKLTRPWSDSFAVSHLVTTVQTLLHRSRRMLGMVIALILAVALVTATAAIAGLVVHQGIQTANFVRDWHKDSFVMATTARFGCPTHRFLAWRSIGCFIYTKCVEM